MLVDTDNVHDDPPHRPESKSGQKSEQEKDNRLKREPAAA